MPQQRNPDTLPADFFEAKPQPGGLLTPGNIDLTYRPRVRNLDGRSSTIRSMSFEEDGKEILVPTVSDDGQILSDEDAVNLYHKTGKHLGIFDNPQSATKFAYELHLREESGKGSKPKPSSSNPDTLPADFFSTPAAPEPRSVAGFAGNVVKSGGKFVGDIVSAVSSPLKTAGAVRDLAGALVTGHDWDKNVKPLVDSYVDKYGGVENLKKTLYEDPVGVLADFATVATGAGVVAKGVEVASDAAKLSRVASAAGKVGKVADVAAQADPLLLAGRGASGAMRIGGKIAPNAAAKLSELPETLYKSAAKFSTTIPESKVDRLVKTAFEHKIPVSEGGLSKLEDLIKDANEKTAALIAKDPGRPIDPANVAKRLESTKAKFANQVAPDADLAVIDKIRDQFMERNTTKAPAPKAKPAGGFQSDRPGYAEAVTGGTDIRLNEIRDMMTDGNSELTGKAKRQFNPNDPKDYGKIEGRFKGVKDVVPELDGFSQPPNVIAAALEKKSGPLYERLRAEVQKFVESEHGPAIHDYLDKEGFAGAASGADELTPAGTSIPIPGAKAQALKTGTYQQLKGKAYGELKSAEIEAQKALARGLKEELEVIYPEIKQMNKQSSDFLMLEPLLERAVRRIGNHQLFGIGTPIAGAGATAVTGSAKAGLVAATLRGILDNPDIKSRIAIALKHAQGKTPQLKGAAKAATVQSRFQDYLTALEVEPVTP